MHRRDIEGLSVTLPLRGQNESLGGTKSAVYACTPERERRLEVSSGSCLGSLVVLLVDGASLLHLALEHLLREPASRVQASTQPYALRLRIYR